MLRGDVGELGRLKVEFARRLGPSWKDLADIFGIQPYEKAGFPPGDEARSIWEWLEVRGRLDELRESLRGVDRADLADLIGDALDASPPPVEAEAVRPPRRRSAWTLASDPDLATHWLPRARGADPGAGGSEWYFTGRRAAVARIAAFLTAPLAPRAPLVVTGEPGSGKSSLLAHVLVLADRRLREDVPERYRTPVTEALVGAVDVAVRATGKSLGDVVAAIGEIAGLTAREPDRLVAEAHGLRHGLRIVVDALDEAKPEHIKPIALLLRQLSLDPDGHGTRVVVGVRRAPAGSSLADVVRLSLRATETTTLPVDRAPYLAYADVVDYVTRRLEGFGQRPTPYTGREVAGQVARAVVTRAAGNFLVAQLASRNLAEEPEVVDTRRRRWWAEFPVDVESAMDQYLSRFGEDERRVRELLTPLAFAHGEGLPGTELWVVAARALSGAGAEYRPADLIEVLDRAATYLVAVEGRYRLFHDALAQYLRNGCPRDDPERELVRAWRAMLGRPADWTTADRYLVTYLARHAADGGELDDLVLDVRFVATAEPGNLTSALRHVHTEMGRRVARAFRQVPARAAEPAQRAAYLTLSAQQLGDTELRDAFLHCGLPLPWAVLDGAWRPPDDYDVVFRLEDATTAVTVLPAEHAGAYVVSGDASGRLRIREIADGLAFPASELDAHESRVSAVAGCLRADGLHLLVSGSVDGEVQLRQVDAGLAAPALDRLAVDAGVIDLAVLAVAGAALVAVADERGGLSLLRFGAGGPVTVRQATVARLRHVALRGEGDSALVIATTADEEVLLLGEEARGFSTGRWSVNAVAVDDRSGTILLGTGGRELLTVDASGESVETRPDAAATGISALSPVAPGDDLPYGGVLLGDGGGVVQFWSADAQGGLSRVTVRRPHQDDVLALSPIYGPAGTSMVSCGRDGKVAIGDLTLAGLELTPQPDVDLVAASPGRSSATVLLREAGGLERWTLRAGRQPVRIPTEHDHSGRVTGTVDGSGVLRQFRSDLDLRGAGSRRPIPMHPFRALAVAAVDGELTTLALRGDGQLELYGPDDLRKPVARVPTGVAHPISLSVGRSASGDPVVVCGDVEGGIRLNTWDDVRDWSRSSHWQVGGADPRTAVAPGPDGHEVLLTGDGAGEVALWRIAGDDLRPLTGAARLHAAPITAVALSGDVAITGDRDGTLVLSSAGGGGLTPRHRVVVGSAVLAIAPLGGHEILVWCRSGALTLTWQ